MANELSTRIDLRLCVLILGAVILLGLPQTALLPLLDRDEPRFAEAAREMIQTGNFIVPHFNGVPRYDKPPLIYWCQAVAYELFGENAFTARLPSLLASAATALLIYTWGVRLGRQWIGLAAALCYSFCLQTVQQGRVATADALLIFFMTLTAFTGWLILRPSSGECAPLRCYLVLALGFAGGFLAKGPEAWLPLLALLWCGRGKRLGLMLGFVGGLAIMLLWGVPAYIETHGDYLWRAYKAGIADRAWGADQGHGASNVGVYLLELPYYLIGFWISALPWSPLILVNVRRLFAGWKPDFADSYLLANIIPLFVIFTFMATKLPHYTLPAFPMIALLFARRWMAAELSPSMPIRLAGGFGVVLAALSVVAIPLAVENGYTPSPVEDLVEAANGNLSAQTQFALVDFKEPTAIWEMRRVSKSYAELISAPKVADYLQQSGPHAVILTTGLWNSLKLPPAPDWKIETASGFNAAKGKMIDLTMIVKR